MEWSVRTSYLRHPVRDLEDLVRRPRHYGIDLIEDAEEARAYIHAIPAHERLWAEGYIELTIGGTVLLHPRLWDYVHVLWHMLVDLGVNLIDQGHAEFSFPDQDIPIVLTSRRGGKAVEFRVHDRTVTTERASFLRQLAEHAARYHEWYDVATGETSTVEHEGIARIREAAGP